jgi:fluoride ion exporter CrcB/FEX
VPWATFAVNMAGACSEAGHAHLVWLNVGLSLIAGYAAIALGHWIGAL